MNIVEVTNAVFDLDRPDAVRHLAFVICQLTSTSKAEREQGKANARRLKNGQPPDAKPVLIRTAIRQYCRGVRSEYLLEFLQHDFRMDAADVIPAGSTVKITGDDCDYVEPSRFFR